MSDGLTDGYRAGRQIRALEEYLGALCVYLRVPEHNPKEQEEWFQVLLSRVPALGVMCKEYLFSPHGYTLGSEDFPHWFRGYLGGLRSKQHDRWLKLLEVARDTLIFQELKKLSPFAEKILIFARKYHDDAEVPQVVIANDRDLALVLSSDRRMYSGAYAIVIPVEDIEFVEIEQQK